jgi:hypothetical protein
MLLCRAINGSGVELTDGCPRGGMELALARAALPWRSSPARASNNSRVELIGCCPRGGVELTRTCCFAAVELAIHGSGAELAHMCHPRQWGGARWRLS